MPAVFGLAFTLGFASEEEFSMSLSKLAHFQWKLISKNFIHHPLNRATHPAECRLN